MTAVRRALGGLPDVADLARPRPAHPWGFVDTADVDLPAAAAACADVDASFAELLPPPGWRRCWPRCARPAS